MAGCIDEIQFVFNAVPSLVVQSHTLGLDGNTTLTLKIHGIKDLLSHLAFCQATADLDKAVCQSGFTMVNMGDYRKISDSAQFSHRQ